MKLSADPSASRFAGACLYLAVLAAAVAYLPVEDVGLGLVAWALALALTPAAEQVVRRLTASRLELPRTARAGLGRDVGLALVGLGTSAVVLGSAALAAALPWLAAAACYGVGGLSLPRRLAHAILAGEARHPRLLAHALVARAAGCGLAIAALVLGAGFGAAAAALLCGAAVETALLVAGARAALAGPDASFLRRGGWRRGGPRIRPGLRVSNALARFDLLLLAVWHGPQAAAVFGTALAIAWVAVALVRAVAGIPRLGVREGGLSPGHVGLRIALGLPAAGLLFASAPVLTAWLALPNPTASSEALRILALAVGIAPLDPALRSWIHGKSLNRALQKVDPLVAAVSLGFVAVLVPAFGVRGAAASVLAISAVRLVAWVLCDWLVSGMFKSPWLVPIAALPGMSARLRARLPGLHAALAVELSTLPRVLGVEVRGRGSDPESFVPGSSDIDVGVAFDLEPHQLNAHTPRLHAIARRHRLPGRVDCYADSAPLVTWTRDLGRIFLTPRLRRTLYGKMPPDAAAPKLSTRIDLMRQINQVLRLQTFWLRCPSAAGGTARGLFAKQVPRLTFLAEASAGLHPPASADADHLALDMQAIQQVLGERLADLGGSFGAAAPKDGARDASLEPVARELGSYVDAVRSSTGVDAFELLPQDAGGDWPVLIGVLPEAAGRDPVAFWLGWRRTLRRLGPVPGLWGEWCWPLLLPAECFRFDTFLSRALLLHRARPLASVAFGAPAPAGREPAAELVAELALASTVKLLWRIPEAMTNARRRGLGDLHVRSLVTCRCPAMRLLLDRGDAPGDLAELARAWSKHQDGPMARLLTSADVARAPREQVVAALEDWSATTMAALRKRLGS
ncbi:MAG: hypothetical protein QNK03_11450 [Myxococcota bacterium]|nr:hypothetical protein [Myxococcota bacterium]